MKLYVQRIGPSETSFKKALSPVTDATKFLTGMELPRGLFGPAVRFVTTSKFVSKEARMFRCNYFSLYYFPPNHFLALFRKTKPAVNVVFDGKVNANPALKEYPTSTTIKIVQGKSVNPFDYACWRKRLTLNTKKAFMKEWLQITRNNHVESDSSCPMDEKKLQDRMDGYYMYLMRLYPTEKSMDDFQEHIKKSLQKVHSNRVDSYLDTPKNGAKKNAHNIDWVDATNKRLSLKNFNNFIKNMDFPYKLIKKTD